MVIAIKIKMTIAIIIVKQNEGGEFIAESAASAHKMRSCQED
jgi:hypothetical protein